jgi:hypothetical protein
MNQLKMNEFGLSESLESVLAQISAIVNVVHHTISSTDASIYAADAAQMLVTAKNLAAEAERYRKEWDALIPRWNELRGPR